MYAGKTTCVKIGPDAKYVAVGSMDRNLRIFGLPEEDGGPSESWSDILCILCGIFNGYSGCDCSVLKYWVGHSWYLCAILQALV